MLTKTQKTRLADIYRGIWPRDQKMVDYCVNKTAALAELPGGGVVPVEKQNIQNRFCFGYGYGIDHADAAASADHARNSADHFKRENMAHFREWLELIGGMAELYGEAPSLPRDVLLIHERPYYTQPDGSDMRGASCCTAGHLLEALGGSARAADLPGLRVTIDGQPYRVPTPDDLHAIRTAYETAARDHEKKIDAYLKRYGLANVRAWTYWTEE